MAIKKNRKYATIMVNHATNKLVDIIPSRDIGDVVTWLKSFKNIKLVTRDGSFLYKQCIINTNTEIVQISDRFHLIKNLSEVLSLELKKINNKRIKVDEIELSTTQKSTVKDKFLKAKKLIETGYCISNACNEAKIDIRLYKKLSKLNDEQFNDYFKRSPIRVVEANFRHNEKRKLIELVREKYSKGISISTIARETNIGRRTVYKYINAANVESLVVRESVDRKSDLDPYKDEIIQKYLEGLKIITIFTSIKSNGYTGSYSSVKMLIKKYKEEGKLTKSIYVTYKDLQNLLFYVRDEKRLKREYLNKVFDMFPRIRTIIELMKEFIYICNNQKGIQYLNSWIRKATQFHGEFLDSFIENYYKDKTAIENAMTQKYSNGIAEAKVNMTKLSKRIMNGRSNFDTLVNKVLYKEYIFNQPKT